MQDDVCVWHLATTGQTLSYRTRYCLTQSIRRDLALLNLSDRTVPYRWLQIVQDRRMYCMAVGRDKPPGLYLALSKLYTYLCKVDQSMALHCFSLFADVTTNNIPRNNTPPLAQRRPCTPHNFTWLWAPQEPLRLHAQQQVHKIHHCFFCKSELLGSCRYLFHSVTGLTITDLQCG